MVECPGQVGGIRRIVGVVCTEFPQVESGQRTVGFVFFRGPAQVLQGQLVQEVVQAVATYSRQVGPGFGVGGQANQGEVTEGLQLLFGGFFGQSPQARDVGRRKACGGKDGQPAEATLFLRTEQVVTEVQYRQHVHIGP